MSIHTETVIHRIPPEDLKFYEHNAKIHKSKLNLLKKSIQLFGFDQPVVVDENLVLLKGHGRVIAAQNLTDISRLADIPVIIREGLSEADKKAIRIMDNLVFEEGSDDAGKKSDNIIGINVDETNLFYALDLPSVSDIDLNMYSASAQSKPKPKKEKDGEDFELITCPKCNKVFEN